MISRIKNKLGKSFVDLDLSKQSTVFISAMGRCGTTWLSNLINYKGQYRYIFEPFIPYKVQETVKFKYLQYFNSEEQRTELVASAKKILSGKFRNDWTDSTLSKHFFTKRLIKDIRTNLMLDWLLKVRPNMPTILLIRSPYSVIDSYKELGWGVEAGGNKSDFERIVSQKNLLSDFPKISNVLSKIDHGDNLSRLAFQWCVLYYVPLKQLSDTDYILVHYEDLLLAHESTLEGIFKYIKQDIDLASLMEKFEIPSVTNYRKVDFRIEKTQLIEKWKKSLSKNDINKINDIINKFELDYLYDKNGYPLKQ